MKTDFGTALDERDESTDHTDFVGTAEYVSPEVMLLFSGNASLLM